MLRVAFLVTKVAKSDIFLRFFYGMNQILCSLTGAIPYQATHVGQQMTDIPIVNVV